MTDNLPIKQHIICIFADRNLKNIQMIKRTTKVFAFLAICAMSLSLFAGNGSEVKIVKDNISTELSSAAEAGLNTILVVTDKTDTRFEEAMKFAGETAGYCENTMIAVVDRDLEENTALVEKYRISRYPAPYLLIMSPGGVITGGAAPGKIDAEKFAAYVPSKCYNKVLTARTEGKSAFIVVSHGTDVSDDLSNVLTEAQTKMEPAAEIIYVNADDAGEKVMLSKIGYKESKTPVVTVVNAKGQVTGSFSDTPASGDLVAAANKAGAKGCGGCASSKSCSGKEKAKCGDK